MHLMEGNCTSISSYEALLGVHYLYFRTVLAIAGENFAVIASDNRLSEGFRIHSRDIPKLYAM
jgi:hypothetical protein